MNENLDDNLIINTSEKPEEKDKFKIRMKTLFNEFEENKNTGIQAPSSINFSLKRNRIIRWMQGFMYLLDNNIHFIRINSSIFSNWSRRSSIIIFITNTMFSSYNFNYIKLLSINNYSSRICISAYILWKICGNLQKSWILLYKTLHR